MAEQTAGGDASAAQKALQEVSRLVDEATSRFEQESFIEAMSSLTAIPTVLEPLISFMGRTWVTAAGLDENGLGGQQAGGMYL